MKNGKKVLGIILSICMILQMLPVFATDITETQISGNIRTIYSNDFDADIEGWVEGEILPNKSEFSLGRADDVDGVSAMVFETTKLGGSSYMCTQPTAYLDFEDIEFKAGNKIIIETKFKQTGTDGNAASYIKYNRPNSADLKTSYVDANGETKTHHVATFMEDATQMWSMLRMNAANMWTPAGTFAEADTISDWTEVKIVIDEGTKKYSVYTKTGETEAASENISMAGSIWETQDFETYATTYDSLDSLTFYMRDYANTLYVDYFSVKEIIGVYAKAQILGGLTVEEGKTADIQFIGKKDADGNESDIKIVEIPENAVKITNANGAELAVVQDYDSVNEILSVKPETDFVEGETYNITLNKEVLSSMDITYQGTETFTVTGRGPRSKGFVVNDTFDDGISEWYAGYANEGYKALTNIVDIEEGNKALEITMEDSTKAAGGSANVVPNIFRNIGNGIEFKEGKDIVVKARIKVASELNDTATGSTSTTLHFRMNASDYNVNLDQHALGWNTYTIMNFGTGGIAHPVGTGRQNGQWGWFYDSTKISGAEGSVAGNWVDYTITLDGTNNKTTINAVCEETGLNATSTKSVIGVTPSSLERVYGAGTNKKTFDALETLNFALFDNAATNSTMLIDYIQVYEEDVYAEISMTKSSYKQGEAIGVRFECATEINEVPLGAVTIEGVETTQSFDAETKVLTLTPAVELETGMTYTVEIDAAKLGEAGILYEGTDTLKFIYIGTYIVYDTFDIDLGSWVKGEFKGTASDMNLLTDIVDGKSVMVIDAFKVDAAHYHNQQPTAYLDFEDIKFKEGNKIVIETRVKQTGNANGLGDIYLKYNRPNSNDIKTSYVDANGTTQTFNPAAYGENAANWWQMLRIYNDKIASDSKTMVEADTVNNWTDVKIVIDEGTKTYSVETKTGDATGLAENEVFTGDLWELQCFDGSKKDYDSLDSLTFFIRGYTNKVYVDYFKVYEIAYADISLTKNSYKQGDEIGVKFECDTQINAVPEDAVTPEGFEATQSFDKETQVLTLTPTTELTLGETYTVKLDAVKLEEAGILYEGEDTLTFSYTGEYIVYDTFDDNVGSWVKGQYKGTATEATLSRVDIDGVSAMEFNATKVDASGLFLTAPSVFLDFEDIEFTEGKKIVIETRVKQTASNGISYIKYNRPDSLNTKNSYVDSNGVTQNAPAAAFAEDASDWWKMLKINAASIESDAGKFVDADTVNNWTDVKIVIDGATKKYSVLTKTGDVTGSDTEIKVTGNIWELQCFDGTITDYDSLDSLTFYIRQNPNTLYVDYFKVYEAENYDAYVIMPDGNTVQAGESVKLTFVSDKEIAEIPTGAVKIDGAGATYTAYDASTNTLSVKPVSGDFAEGGVYNVTIDASILEIINVGYTGTTSFTVTGRGTRETGKVVSDNFAENEGTWYVGTSQEGYSASIEVVSDEGAKDGKALKIDFPERGTSAKAQYGSVTKKIGNGIGFNEDTKVVIETRVKKTSADGHFALKLNRPDSTQQFKNDVAWPTIYSLFENNASDIKITQGVWPEKSDEDTYWCPKLQTLYGTQDFDSANKWLTYKLVLDYSTKTIYTTITYTDENGEEVTLINDNPQGIMLAARWDIDALHGKGAYDVIDRYYQALDRLTFTSTNDCDIYVDYINVYTARNVEENISAKLIVDGVETSTLTAGATVVPAFNLQPKDEAETTYYIISAKYVNGVLESCIMTPVTTTGGTYTHTGYTLGNDITGVEIKAFVWDTNYAPLCTPATAEAQKLTVYVRPNGNDNATGDSDAPVASLSQALEIVYNATSNEDIKEAKIVVGGGNYKVEETIQIPKSATIPADGLTIENAEGEAPVFVGGNTYTADQMVKVAFDDPNLARVPEGARDNIYKVELGVNVPGVSYPGQPAYSIDKAVRGLGLENYETLSNVTAEASFDGELMTIARWPNEGYSKLTKVYDSVANTWITSASDSAYRNIYNASKDFSGKTQAQIQALKSDELIAKAKTGITFGVDTSKNVSDWANASDALMFGYWFYDWATQTMPLGSIDTVNNAVTSKYASFYGAKKGARFYVFNLLEELDADGEYYIDRTSDDNDVLYFYKEQAPDADSKITLSLLSDSAAMLKISSNAKITVDGLTFENSRGTGISLSGSENTVIQNCELRNLGSSAISVSAINCIVKNNYIHDTNGGINVGHPGSFAANLTKSNNIVANNEIKNFSRLDKVYIDAINVSGVANKVYRNKIHQGEHLAVRITGYLNEFYNNEITDVLRECDDAGAIYMGRTWADRGNKIYSNYIHDLATGNTDVGSGDSPVAGIFLDDHYAGGHIEGNVFKNINGHGVRLNRGRENTITNNLFIGCTNGGVLVTGPDYNDEKTYANDYTDSHGTTFERMKGYMENTAWKETFPALCAYATSTEPEYDFGTQAFNIITKNLTIDCGSKNNNMGVTVSAFAAVYDYPSIEYTDSDGVIKTLSLDGVIENNASVENTTDAVLGKNSYVTKSVTSEDSDFAAVVNNPALATIELALKAGITGFVPIDFASMRK